MTTPGDLLRHYLGLALKAAGTRVDSDVRVELEELATAIDHQADLEKEIGRLRTRLEHLEEYRETLDKYLEAQARK
jgi:predicted  nucleic acid-binding Zn-ribbon protein